MATPRSRVVFVGNIPYDMSEEQLISIFSEVGPVAGFRLVFDRDTGKPKGYGFCEFNDPETAASAVRNLNDVDVGGRSLRIDWADVDPVFQGRTTQMGQIDGELPRREGRRPGNPAGGPNMMGGQQGGFQRQGGPQYGQGFGGPAQGGPGGPGGPGPMGMGMGMGMGGGPGGPAMGMPPQQGPYGGQQQQQQQGTAPMNYNTTDGLPPGVNLPPGQNATDAITQTLATLPPDQLLDIMGQIKSLIITSPQSAQNLLSSHPQLTYALFQAMLMMNLVDPAILQRILAGNGAMQGQNAPSQPLQQQQQQQQQRYPGMGGPGAPGPGPPPPGPPPPNPAYGMGGGPGFSNTPPPHPQMNQQQGRPMAGGFGGHGNAPTPPPGAQQHQQGGGQYPYGGGVGANGPPGGPGAAAAPSAAANALSSLSGGAASNGGANLPDAQRQLLMQVLSLSDAQINALPPDQKDSIMMLRRQMGK